MDGGASAPSDFDIRTALEHIGNVAGAVLGGMLPPRPPWEDEPEPAGAETWGVVATISALNVRADPWINDNVIGTLAPGTVVEVLKWEANGWAEIDYQPGGGYVNGRYLEKV